MDKIKVIHDAVGRTLTVWFDEHSKESICEETTDEVVLVKNAERQIIGFELLHYHPAADNASVAVEAIVRLEP